MISAGNCSRRCAISCIGFVRCLSIIFGKRSLDRRTMPSSCFTPSARVSGCSCPWSEALAALLPAGLVCGSQPTATIAKRIIESLITGCCGLREFQRNSPGIWTVMDTSNFRVIEPRIIANQSFSVTRASRSMLREVYVWNIAPDQDPVARRGEWRDQSLRPSAANPLEESC